MATITDGPPDKIEKSDFNRHLFYFTGGQDIATLPAGAQYVIVYEPNPIISRWRAVMYEVMPVEGYGTWKKEIGSRRLTDEEIAHFEGLIADRGE
jgi:hypothetical protein